MPDPFKNSLKAKRAGGRARVARGLKFRLQYHEKKKILKSDPMVEICDELKFRIFYLSAWHNAHDYICSRLPGIQK
jgi:hypothetical protein